MYRKKVVDDLQNGTPLAYSPLRRSIRLRNTITTSVSSGIITIRPSIDVLKSRSKTTNNQTVFNKTEEDLTKRLQPHNSESVSQEKENTCSPLDTEYATKLEKSQGIEVSCTEYIPNSKLHTISINEGNKDAVICVDVRKSNTKEVYSISGKNLVCHENGNNLTEAKEMKSIPEYNENLSEVVVNNSKTKLYKSIHDIGRQIDTFDKGDKDALNDPPTEMTENNVRVNENLATSTVPVPPKKEIINLQIPLEEISGDEKLCELQNIKEKFDSEEKLQTTLITKKKIIGLQQDSLSIILEKNGIDSKIEDLIINAEISASESDQEPNSFVETMAEEGEEDTPSEGSNDITVIGEEINTTESDFSTDESYDQNSFIDDEESYQLLSGEEYDLSFEHHRKKRRRIMELSSGSDYEIIHIRKPDKKNVKKKKKSRIIKYETSSSDEGNLERSMIQSKSDETSKVKKEHQKVQAVSGVNGDVLLSSSALEHNAGIPEARLCNFIETENAQDKQNEKKNENINGSLSGALLTSKSVFDDCSNVKCSDKKIIILENIKVQDIQDKTLSDSISTIVGSLNNGIKNAKEAFINLSLLSNENLKLQDLSKTDQHVIDFANINNNPQERSLDYQFLNESKIDKMQSEGRRKKKARHRKTVTSITNEIQGGSPINNTKVKHSNSERICENVLEQNNILPLYNSVKKTESVVETKTANSRNCNIKKRKLSIPYIFIPSTNCNEIYNDKPACKKRKKKRSLQKYRDDNGNMKMKVSNAAILDDIETRAPRLNTNLLDEEWTVHCFASKSGQASKKEISKKMKCSQRSGSFHIHKVQPKDFRNLMLYDNERVKRMETQQLITKKIF